MTPDNSTTAPASRAVQYWLFGVAALVLAMVVVGGATRLTDSGLSITEWKPLLGAIPPLSGADWIAAFEKYKLIPEYREINEGMSLAQFKFIYWWEWSHRFLGRFIGVAFAVPFIFFVLRGAISRALMPRLIGLFILGGLQGFAGWYMVQSGLTERVDVSQYRLALHLALAVLIFGLLIWNALSLRPRNRGHVRLATTTRTQHWGSRALVGLIFLQIILGAFVAGLKAGLAYNDWPLMDGQLIPDGLGIMTPWYVNLFENAMTVQFDHRIVAYGIAVLAAWHAVSIVVSADDERIARSSLVLLAAVILQAGLGIWTLLAHVPLFLALLHQASAIVLMGIAVWHRHRMWRTVAD